MSITTGEAPDKVVAPTGSDKHAGGISSKEVSARKHHRAGPNSKVSRRVKAGVNRKVAVKSSTTTQTAKVIGLIKRPDGASLKELMKSTGWKEHSVRGFVSGILRKKM